jgi:glycosyltransferase involved in cell wall biosynthesis
MKFSVVVTTYKRYQRLGIVLKSWIDAGADEVILANGGKWFNAQLPIKQFLFRPDPGNKIRFAAASLARNDFIVLADDDVVVKRGIFEDFHKCWKKAPGIYGIIGRLPTSDNYFKCPFIRSSKIDKPVQTFFCGVIYFTHRRDLLFDLKKLDHRAYDDLYWHLIAKANIKKYVFPTDKYENLKPECNDPGSIFKKDKEKRNKFYQGWFYNQKIGG